jgi:hypothetical protein
MFPENDPLWAMDHHPPLHRMEPVGDEQFEAMVRQEDQGQPAAPRAYAAAAFKHAGGNVPEPTPGVGNWKLLHLYPSLDRIVLGDLESIAVAATHFTHTANMVAVHPLVHQLVADYPCILNVLQARMFTAFDIENRYDPERKFAPGENHDLTGFVLKREPAA